MCSWQICCVFKSLLIAASPYIWWTSSLTYFSHPLVVHNLYTHGWPIKEANWGGCFRYLVAAGHPSWSTYFRPPAHLGLGALGLTVPVPIHVKLSYNKYSEAPNELPFGILCPCWSDFWGKPITNYISENGKKQAEPDKTSLFPERERENISGEADNGMMDSERKY